MTPPKSTRGGDSTTHRYLVQELSARLPQSTVEVTVGGKSIDILLRYQDKDHRKPFATVMNNGTTLTGQQPHFREDALVGIEVEVSNPTTTGTNNALKNHEVGITTTIIAVMPGKDRALADHLANTLQPAHHDTVVIIDALEWLESLRTTPHPKNGGSS